MDNSKFILYLDFDGTIHHENVLWHPKKGAFLSAPPEFKLFQHAPLLATLLEPYPHVKIVLSTAWVLQYGYSKCVKKLPHELQKRCIGGTYHSYMDKYEFRQSSRGMQIWSDVTRRKPDSWLALDDDDFNWPKWCLNHLIKTDSKHGIYTPELLSLIQTKFNEHFSLATPPIKQKYS